MTISDPEQTNIDHTVSQLLEHYDSVRIFVTRQNGEKAETESYDSGGGNLYAQLGQIIEWIEFQKQYARTFAENRQDQQDKEGEE